MSLIRFFNDPAFTRDLLIPEYQQAPRYLLPARSSLYMDQALTNAAPLYPRFYEIMKDAVAVTGPKLNQRLRDIGKTIDQNGFSPR